MRGLSRDEAIAWCQEHRVALTNLALPELSDVDLKFKIPSDAQERVHLVNRAMEAFADEPSYLVWFTDWSVWSSGDRMHIFDRFRMSYGETRRLIDSPGHVFDQKEIEDATSFVTIAALFLWDCYVVGRQGVKLFFLSHDEWGAAKGMDLQAKVKLTIVPFRADDTGGGLKLYELPVWQTALRDPPAGDPVGCPVSTEEMIQYLTSLLRFDVRPANFEFIKKGQVGRDSFWLWAFYGYDGHRWNLCVFSGPERLQGKYTWMCCDNNPYNMKDDDYIAAIHNQAP
jgi:hypothetical protein